jgi:hypothetical protein
MGSREGTHILMVSVCLFLNLGFDFQLEFRQYKFKICPHVLAMNYFCPSTDNPESYNQYLLIQPNDRVSYGFELNLVQNR